MLGLRRTTAACGLAALLACQGLAHVSDFRVDDGLCNACPPSSQDLRHAPCSNGGGTTGSTYVFAWRSLQAGADASSYQDPSYDFGLDQDCSTRAGDSMHATGEPVWCSALAPFRGIISSPTSWVADAHGIDNSLSQRVIEPLAHFANVDFDAVLSAGLEQGSYTELVVVDGWDGSPNDDSVLTSFMGSPGTVGGKTPVWDGSDVWMPNSVYSSYPHFPSYVSQGVLVADTRGVGVDTSTIALSVGNQTFTFRAELMVRVGPITPSHLRMTTAGIWNLVDAKQQVPTVAMFLGNAAAAGNPSGATDVASILMNILPGLLDGAADLPPEGEPTYGMPCAAISFGFVSEAYPARIPFDQWQ